MVLREEVLHLHFVAVHAERLDGLRVGSVVVLQQAGVVVAGDLG